MSKSEAALACGTWPGVMVCEAAPTARAPTRSRSEAEDTPISALMTSPAVSVRPDLRLDRLVDLLLAHGLRGVPVVDHRRRPIGMVSKSDLVGAPPVRRARQVADVMMCLAFTLPETASVARAAALMTYEGVHRLPVVAADGQLVGVLSALDITRWLAG
jgi:CBS domain-containing protein